MAAFGELDLSPSLMLRAGMLLRRTSYTIAALEYDRIVPTVGVLWTRGF